MSYIRKFSIDCLKVAKELVDHIDSDENALLIVKSIIMMTKGMGIRTIAEGVEYESQFEILKGLGCDEIQGYLLGRPVPSIEFEKLYLMPTHPSGA